MRVLIGFEESQTVCKAFRNLGHEAYSCDLQECSGGHPEWHIKNDIFIAIQYFGKWDLIILHPPCTYTALCGNRWYYDSPLREQGAELCLKAWDAACKVCERVVLEQPKTIMGKYLGLKSQVIHPWQFGHGETKETWLWIKGLPLLEPTDIVEGRENRIWKMPPSADRGKLRSKTYPGIAAAMAKQWGSQLTLKVGGIYKRRDGITVKVISDNNSIDMPYKAVRVSGSTSFGSLHRADGVTSLNGKQNSDDIITEIFENF